MFDPALAELVDRYWFAVLRRVLERQSIWEFLDYGPVCVNNSEDSSIQGYRKMLCDRLGLRHTEYHSLLDDLSQYSEATQLLWAIDDYLKHKEKREMSKFPELKPMMLVECKDSNDIYEFYLIIGKPNESLYEAYKLFISSTGEVELQFLVRLYDLAGRAVAVYASNNDDIGLATGVIARIANGNPEECARRIVWQRENPPLEVTMEEVCAKFGQEVKIVKEK